MVAKMVSEGVWQPIAVGADRMVGARVLMLYFGNIIFWSLFVI